MGTVVVIRQYEIVHRQVGFNGRDKKYGKTKH